MNEGTLSCEEVVQLAAEPVGEHLGPNTGSVNAASLAEVSASAARLGDEVTHAGVVLDLVLLKHGVSLEQSLLPALSNKELSEQVLLLGLQTFLKDGVGQAEYGMA